MARPKKSEAPNLAERVNLTVGAIERLTCPSGKQQAFMRDTEAPSLRVRVTAAGAKSFVFEAKLNRQTIRRTIGDVRDWTIEKARAEARDLAVMLDKGTDPRELERQQLADKAARQDAAAAQALTVGEVWTVYIEARRKHWGERHYVDHVRLVAPGGEEAKRGIKVEKDKPRPLTQPGLLYPLMSYRLADLTPSVVEAWAARNGAIRPTSARLALRCLKAFLNWCEEQDAYAPILQQKNPAATTKTREALGKANVKKDALLREQLPAWFDAVRKIGNPIAAAYLQVLLLTGARPGEVLAMRWEDVNTKWKGLTIRDKVEGERTIPLTPYVSDLLHSLPRRNEFVFPSTPRGKDTGGKTLSIPRAQHTAACAVAGIKGLTLHGLRRSFRSLTEWLEIPAGVVAQIQGHKPSATAEKHYTVRPLDLLRVHHARIEAWILKQAEIDFVPKEEPGKLSVVA